MLHSNWKMKIKENRRKDKKHFTRVELMIV